MQTLVFISKLRKSVTESNLINLRKVTSDMHSSIQLRKVQGMASRREVTRCLDVQLGKSSDQYQIYQCRAKLTSPQDCVLTPNRVEVVNRITYLSRDLTCTQYFIPGNSLHPITHSMPASCKRFQTKYFDLRGGTVNEGHDKKCHAVNFEAKEGRRLRICTHLRGVSFFSTHHKYPTSPCIQYGASAGIIGLG